MDNKQVTAEWIAQQRAVCEETDMSPLGLVVRGNRCSKALPAVLDALEASMQREAEKDATIIRLTAERDAAVKDLTTAMTDLYIEGRIDETDICWACKFAKNDKDEYPCNSCINYEMTEFTHRGAHEDE